MRNDKPAGRKKRQRRKERKKRYQIHQIPSIQRISVPLVHEACLGQWFSNSRVHQNHLAVLLKAQERAWEFAHLTSFPGAAAATPPGTTLRKLTYRMKSPSLAWCKELPDLGPTYPSIMFPWILCYKRLVLLFNMYQNYLTCFTLTTLALNQNDSPESEYTALTYSFPNLEPVCCPMSSSNCCFLIYIQISQEASKVVCYSHLFKKYS